MQQRDYGISTYRLYSKSRIFHGHVKRHHSRISHPLPVFIRQSEDFKEQRQVLSPQGQECD